MVKLLGRPELAADLRFAIPRSRREHWLLIRAMIVDWLDGLPSVEHALEALGAARIPAAPVLSPAEVTAHPHLAARGAFPRIPHPARGTVAVTATPFHVDQRPVTPGGAAPYRAGEHTRDVLGGILGYSAARIDELVKSGAIAMP